MHGDWKKACEYIQQGSVLAKGSDITENSVSSWHQLLRYLELNKKIQN